MTTTTARVAGALALAGGLLTTSAPAWASEGAGMSYPDWRGQWHRIGGLSWPPEGYDEAGPPPLTEEYQEIREGYLALREVGVQAGDPPTTCLPPGMPRVMKASFPLEFIITPEVTYIYAEWESQLRRVYTDGSDWPDYMLPAFNGHSIGEWQDQDGDGEYDLLKIETRGLKGPRVFDSHAVPLHENNETVIHEEIRLIDENTMENVITTIDDALTEPWTIHQRYRRQTEDVVWVEYVCAENNRHIQLGDDWYFLNDRTGTLDPTREGQPRLVPETELEAD